VDVCLLSVGVAENGLFERDQRSIGLEASVVDDAAKHGSMLQSMRAAMIAILRFGGIRFYHNLYVNKSNLLPLFLVQSGYAALGNINAYLIRLLSRTLHLFSVWPLRTRF
jgi:hypothetical protein